MSDQRTRIDTLLNHSVPAPAPEPDASVYVDGRLVRPDATGSTAFDLTPAGVVAQPVAQPATRPATRPVTTAPASSAQVPGTGSHVPAGRLQGPARQHPQHTGSQSPPADHLKGLGKHPAQIDVTDPSGKQHVPYTVHKNKDGSLDVTVPKGPGHPHATRIHVPPGKHVNLNLSQDKNGHVKVQTTPAAKPTPPGTKPTAPNQLPGAKGPAAPAMPSAGGPPSGGGGSPSGGGGSPSGGGGSPSGGGGFPTGGGPTSAVPTQKAPGGDNQTRIADQTAMKKLGDQIEQQPGQEMKAASDKTAQIDVGFPSFGVLGIPLSSTHDQVRQSATQYLAQGHDQLTQWKTALHNGAQTWNGADTSSTIQTTP